MIHMNSPPLLTCTFCLLGLFRLSSATTSTIFLRGDSKGRGFHRNLITFDPKTVTLKEDLEQTVPATSIEIPSSEIKTFMKENLEQTTPSPISEHGHLHTLSKIGRHVVFCAVQADGSQHQVNFDIVRKVVEENIKQLSRQDEYTFHVITNGDEAMEALSKIEGIKLVNLRNEPAHDRLQKFKETYVPQSRADIEFEAYCMWRWIVICDYFNSLMQQGVPVNYIISLDTDVIFLDDPFTVDREIDWSVVESYRIIDGAAAIWSLSGLNSFVNFLVDSYSSREKAKEFVLKHGQTAACNKVRSQLVPCVPIHDEASDTNVLVMFHMTDVHWYFAYSDQSPETRFKKPVTDFRGEKGMDCYVAESLQDRTIHFVRKEDGIYENSDTQIKKFCAVHFQGWTKSFITEFVSYLESDKKGFLMDLGYE